MKQIQFPALLDQVSTRKDRSLKVILSTQEMNGEDMAELFKYRDQVGYVTFSAAPEARIDVPDAPIETDSKSPSQRLRSVLFVLWEQKYQKQYQDFDLFYIWYMNRIMDQIKEKLDD